MARKPKQLRAVNYNAGNISWYRKNLAHLVRSMSKTTRTTLLNIFDNQSPSVDIAKRVLGDLSDVWLDRFLKDSHLISAEMVSKTIKSADINLLQLGKVDGFKINLNWTPELEQLSKAVIAENVSLIKSIPEKYFTEVEGMVYRSVAKGGDSKGLIDDLNRYFSEREHITTKRVTNIAQDQIRKATASLTIERQKAAGVTHGIWIHSAGQANPRKAHVEAHGKVFKLSDGYPCGPNGKYVKPAEEINCSCTFRPVPPWEEIPNN